MFDPVHNGHVDVIQRSLQIFDELIVAVVANPSKQPLFTMKERLEMIDDPEQKISRPRQIYTGLRDVDYVPIDQREGPEKITNDAVRRPVRKRRGA